MNSGTVTGGVVKAATSAYTSGGLRRVQFPIAVKDSHGQRAFWNCEAEGDPVWLDLVESAAQPGRGIKLDYELATRPFLKHGVHAGEVRFLRVIKAEFAPARDQVPEPVEVGA